MRPLRCCAFLALVVVLSPWQLQAQSASLPLAVPNPNTRAAGVQTANTVTLRMVAQVARWYPESDSGPSLDVEAFGEEGSLPTIPGPLIRAAVGTVLQMTIRNALPDSLLLFGLSAKGNGIDTLRIAPGGTIRTSTVLQRAGTYAYGGATVVDGVRHPLGTGNQLLGALIVDGPQPYPDRVFVMSIWPPNPGRFVLAINGKSWPHTERLAAVVGDSVRWRVINGTRGRHPMHLHGFYFRIDARGSWFADTTIADDRPQVVTESVPFRGTFTMTWIPERPGNWLFHCHDALHTTWRRRYNITGERPPPTLPMHDAAHHAEMDMSGLVLAIRTRARGNSAQPDALPAPRRSLRLRVNEFPGHYGFEPAFSYDMRNDNAAATLAIPAAPLILTRGEPTAITIVNRLSIATAVHWHGIELESYFDGVAGWSGDDTRLAPIIVPNDSFTVHMTPPRAGTFIFHAHVDDMRQMALGLYGPLIVLAPGERWDPATDHLFIVSQLGRGADARTGLNGTTSPPPLAIAAGTTHRVRFINISIEDDAEFTLLADSAVQTWRPVAKDGADLPARRVAATPARIVIAPGETYDFEVRLRAGTYRLQMNARDSTAVSIVVR